jgi:hypothetical protein
MCEFCGKVIWVDDSEINGINGAKLVRKINRLLYGKAQVYLDPVWQGSDTLGNY